MERYSYKRTQSINSIKKQNKFKSTIMSFSSEQDSSINSITSSPKISDKFNNYNSLYSSFKKYNKTNNTNNDNDSKKNVSEESSVKYLKKYSPKIKKSMYYAFPPLTNLNNNVKENSFDLNNNNSNNYIIFNGKNHPLRNNSNKLNSGKISTVKEEQEKEQTYLVDNKSNNILTNIKTEEYKIQIYYEGKYIDFTLNKNDKFKKLILLTQKKLFPYHQIVNYDILYKLKKIDIVNSFNLKLSEIIGELENNETTTFLLKKKENITKKNHHGTSVTIENFPSLTDLAIDLNYFFKKETRESDFIVDYKKNMCKVVFSYPEKAFSLVSFLSKLKLQKPIYKLLKVNLDYKIKVITNAKKHRQNQPKIMLPLLKKKIINNLKNDNFYIKDPNQSPSYRRKNIKLFLPNYFSFSKNNKQNIFNDEVLFLYRKKQKKLKNVNSDVNIKSNKDKDYINNNLSEIKNKNKSKKILSIFDKDRRSVLATKKVKRNSVFYNMPIAIKINNENNNNNNNNNINESINDSMNKSIISKNSKKNESNKNVIVRSLTNKDYTKSKFSENKDKKNNNNESPNENQDNKNKDLYIMKLIQDAKVSEESSSSSNKSSSSYDISNNEKNKKSFFNGKNQEFMFFKGLTKRPKRKYNEYIGRRDY